jgi:hypothetical protein
MKDTISGRRKNFLLQGPEAISASPCGKDNESQSVPQRKQQFSVTKIIWLMLLEEVISHARRD